MGKQWVRQQVRHNEVQDALDISIRWVKKNRQVVMVSVITGFVLTLVMGFILYRSHSLTQEAWSRLTLAQSYAYMGRTDQSLDQIGKLNQDFGHTDASAYAALFAGDVLFRSGKYKKAIESYARVIGTGPLAIQPIAISNTAVAYEAAGDFAQAAANGRNFLNAHSDHFLAPYAHATLARSLARMGQKEEALLAFQKITLQYPDTPWANWAKEHLEAGKK